jgi:hypothetical protein
MTAVTVKPVISALLPLPLLTVLLSFFEQNVSTFLFPNHISNSSPDLGSFHVFPFPSSSLPPSHLPSAPSASIPLHPIHSFPALPCPSLLVPFFPSHSLFPLHSRSAQPLVGLTQKSCSADEKLLNLYRLLGQVTDTRYCPSPVSDTHSDTDIDTDACTD